MTMELQSPFKYQETIHRELMEDFKRIRVSGETLEQNSAENRVKEICSWLCETPNSSTYRVNTIVASAPEICNLINKDFPMPLHIQLCKIPEVIIVHGWNDSVKLDLEKRAKEVTVSATCGAAVLRGSHVFAPGVVSMPAGSQIGDEVSVFADLSGNCKKGAKIYTDSGKIFLGNGIVQKNRRELFEEHAHPSGIAVRITAAKSRLPQLGDSSVTKGYAILQNTPSIICSRILDPQPGERILDMCAAPGNKTTHISALMKGEGTLIALEKMKSKIPRLKNNCQIFRCKNVKVYCFDSTKAACNDENIKMSERDAPPFAERSFDRILLDGPCSALGQRPQLLNKIRPKDLRSYVSLQRKLFSTAVKLLKIGGVLVYATCTVTIAENEGIVAWALRSYPELKLVSPRDILESTGLDDKYRGTSGYSIDGLDDDQSKNLLRFGLESDTIGFFIARFIKIDSRSEK